MKFIKVHEARANLSKVMDLAQEAPVVLTRQGEPTVLLIGVVGLDAEQIALGVDDDLWLEVEQARHGKYVSAKEARRRLGVD